MSRIQTPAIQLISVATTEVYAEVQKLMGGLPNTFAAIGAHGPAALKSILQADEMLSVGSLSKQDPVTVKLVVSSVAGCEYSIAMYSHLGKLAGMREDELDQIRHGRSTGDIRRDPLSRFVRNLMHTSGTIREQLLDQVKAAGYSEAQLVDICLAIAVATFANAFNRINDTDLDFPPAP